jgi:hypothetical protein
MGTPSARVDVDAPAVSSPDEDEGERRVDADVDALTRITLIDQLMVSFLFAASPGTV